MSDSKIFNQNDSRVTTTHASISHHDMVPQSPIGDASTKAASALELNNEVESFGSGMSRNNAEMRDDEYEYESLYDLPSTQSFPTAMPAPSGIDKPRGGLDSGSMGSISTSPSPHASFVRCADGNAISTSEQLRGSSALPTLTTRFIYSDDDLMQGYETHSHPNYTEYHESSFFTAPVKQSKRSACHTHHTDTVQLHSQDNTSRELGPGLQAIFAQSLPNTVDPRLLWNPSTSEGYFSSRDQSLSRPDTSGALEGDQHQYMRSDQGPRSCVLSGLSYSLEAPSNPHHFHGNLILDPQLTHSQLPPYSYRGCHNELDQVDTGFDTQAVEMSSECEQDDLQDELDALGSFYLQNPMDTCPDVLNLQAFKRWYLGYFQCTDPTVTPGLIECWPPRTRPTYHKKKLRGPGNRRNDHKVCLIEMASFFLSSPAILDEQTELDSQIGLKFDPYACHSSSNINMSFLQHVELTLLELLGYFHMCGRYHLDIDLRLTGSGLKISEHAGIIHALRHIEGKVNNAHANLTSRIGHRMKRFNKQVKFHNGGVGLTDFTGTPYTVFTPQSWPNVAGGSDIWIVALGLGIEEEFAGPDRGPLTELISCLLANNRPFALLSDVLFWLEVFGISPQIQKEADPSHTDVIAAQRLHTKYLWKNPRRLAPPIDALGPVVLPQELVPPAYWPGFLVLEDHKQRSRDLRAGAPMVQRHYGNLQHVPRLS
ncbi:hypothetical protein BDV96DRAFT_605212 [Lophiotrema nucula]|uniref:Uncharacterized protein n=1 Tax=Lophiotrema nucula TaxID=690887 RepID=A0A6A5YPX9_9PLEO|nr:hypothetical protein BDV96DRAFT_605212 [Lophiotrema nucula]